MGLFIKKPQRDLALMIEVQSSLVRCSLVALSRQDLPHILYTHSTVMPYKPHTGSGYMVKAIIKAVGEDVSLAMRNFHARARAGQYDDVSPRINSVHYILCAPWVISQARSISLDLPQGTRLSQDMLSQIIKKDRVGADPALSGDLSIIEDKVFDVQINGYSVSDWQGRTASDVHVSFVTSMAGSRLINHLGEAVRMHVQTKQIHFHSSLLLQSIGIQTITADMPGSIMIHAHGELTEIALANRGCCFFFGSFPLGIRGIIRRIAHDMGTDMSAADSALSLHSGGHLDHSHANRVNKIIKDATKEWVAGIQSIYASAMTPLTIPKDVIIITHVHRDFFINAYRTAYPDARIHTISQDDFAGHVTFGEGAERLSMPAICATALHCLSYR